MIEDFNRGARTFAAAQRVVIPRRPWNPAGVEPTGYQLVPILVYHNLGPQAKGRRTRGSGACAEQMRYLKREGYRVVSVAEFVEWLGLKRALAREAGVATFDDARR